VVDRYVVRARIAKIRQYVALLKKIRGLANEATFVKDPLIYGNAERYRQLAIQALLDISNHIVADMNLNLPGDSKELFDLLAKHKVLPVRLPSGWSRWPASATFWPTSIWKSIDTGSIAL